MCMENIPLLILEVLIECSIWSNGCNGALRQNKADKSWKEKS
jgi:hypothetical protein